MQAPITEWRTNGGSLSNQRYSPLTALNSSNIAGLKGVWHTRLRGSGNGPQYSGEAQPLVDDGVAYIVTGADDVFAVSIDSVSECGYESKTMRVDQVIVNPISTWVTFDIKFTNSYYGIARNSIDCIAINIE